MAEPEEIIIVEEEDAAPETAIVAEAEAASETAEAAESTAEVQEAVEETAEVAVDLAGELAALREEQERTAAQMAQLQARIDSMAAVETVEHMETVEPGPERDGKPHVPHWTQRAPRWVV